MRIAVFMHDLSSGGAEKIMVGFINYLANKGNDEVLLILSQKKGPYLSLVNPRVEIIDLNAGSTLRSVKPLYNYLKSSNVDVVYSTLRNANVIAVVIGKMLNKKVIIREANTIKAYNETRKIFIDKVTINLIRYIYKYAYKCIAISNNVKKDLVEFTSLPADKIEVIYNPIIIIDKLEDIQLDAGYFHIGLVSRLATQKNIPTVAKIIEHFMINKQKVKFHFFGEGNDKWMLDDLITKYNDDSTIQFHGFEISYYSYIKKMGMFIHIPLWEGLGNSVLEVYNSGIPMILSDVQSGFSELIKPEYTNVHYFHPLNNVPEIISLIEKYISNNIAVVPNRPRLMLSESDTYLSYRSLI